MKLPIIATLLAVASVAEAHPHCTEVIAVIVDAPTTENCSSPYGFCIAGHVIGDDGFIGSTLYTFDGFSPAPATSPDNGESTGTEVYTLWGGTLTTRETGVGNMGAAAVSGEGAGFEQILSGTGQFSGATGVLFLSQTAANGEYTSHVHGQVCTP
ncbi:MAG TPA: hypothetical protein VGM88_19130 [Kofleriaceae bacterium]|jgi:hypothetical protein